MGRALGVANSTADVDSGTITGVATLGNAATGTLGFFGVTPVVRRSDTAGQTALSTSVALAVTTISSGAFGYTSVQANGLLAAVNEIQAVLRLYGLIP